MVLIGIGNAGNNLIKEFSDEHKKISILPEDFPKKCKKTEDYEKFCPSFSKKLKFDEEECWVALCGAGKVAGCTLRVLEKIKHKKINILYIYPDADMINSLQYKRNKVVFNVLQEITRSGLLNKIYLFSNKSILNIIGDQTLTTMYQKINYQIANAIETIGWFSDQEPVIGSGHNPKLISRICTISVGKYKENEENMFFPLDSCTETHYIYSISKTQLDKNKDLLKMIKDRINIDKGNNIISSFTVYPSSHKQSFFYSIKYSHTIQPMESE